MIAPDLRGLGDTSRPAHGYDKRTVAGDVRELLRDHLKLDTIGLVGHDWGGPTVYALTRLDPALVNKLAIIDVVIPGDGRPGGIAQGGARWHHGFHRTPHLPEALTAGREAIYLSYFYEEYVSVAGAITAADIAEYARTYAQPGAMRCGFEFYRATDEDARVNAEELARLGKLRIPVLGIAGGAGRGRGAELEELLGGRRRSALPCAAGRRPHGSRGSAGAGRDVAGGVLRTLTLRHKNGDEVLARL